MSFAQEHIELFSTVPLQSLFPGGMFDPDASPGAGNASRALSIIESLIKESTARNALLSRYALLQSFPRIVSDPDAGTEKLHGVDDAPAGHGRGYAGALTPEWYQSVLAAFDENEVELFLKIFLLGHEIWGHADGIALVVRMVVEHVAGTPVPVVVEHLKGEEKRVPEHLQSRLGSYDNFTTLGKDFVLGNRFLCRPEHHHIRIGPISLRLLEKLQQHGWAEETRASRKLESLVEIASPFYFHAKIHIVIETIGCVLGRVMLGQDRLGTVASDRDEAVGALLGVN